MCRKFSTARSPRRPVSRSLAAATVRGNPPAGCLAAAGAAHGPGLLYASCVQLSARGLAATSSTPAGSSDSAVVLRLLAAVAALVVGVVAIVVVVVLLHDTPGPVATTTSVAPPAGSSATAASPTPSTGFPAPPQGATVFTHQDGGSVLALAVTPQGRRLGLQASVVGQQGGGTSGLGVSFASGGKTAAATACGPGCYRATLAPAGPPRAIDVAVRGKGLDTRWHQQLPATWPAPSGAALLENADHVWRTLRSLSYVEHLASDPKHAVTSTWRVSAPDRAAYQVQGGYGGIIIGGKRWDRPPGGRWIESGQTAPITQPVPFWVGFRNAHVVGSGTVGGHPVWLVSFFDPRTPAWFQVALDKRTSRTLKLQMMTTAHFMHDTYSAFDTAPPITPP